MTWEKFLHAWIVFSFFGMVALFGFLVVVMVASPNPFAAVCLGVIGAILWITWRGRSNG